MDRITIRIRSHALGGLYPSRIIATNGSPRPSTAPLRGVPYSTETSSEYSAGTANPSTRTNHVPAFGSSTSTNSSLPTKYGARMSRAVPLLIHLVVQHRRPNAHV